MIDELREKVSALKTTENDEYELVTCNCRTSSRSGSTGVLLTDGEDQSSSFILYILSLLPTVSCTTFNLYFPSRLSALVLNNREK